MKNNFLVIAIICISTVCFGQTVEKSQQDIFDAKYITFYGYDFTAFQFSDNKRLGQDLKSYILSLIGFYNEHLPEKKLQKWMKKDSIFYNFNPTLQLNKKILNEDIASPIKHSIDKVSLQPMIDKYSISQKDGIGFVIIFECFDNASKRVSGYSVFFNTSTKKIIAFDYASNHGNNSFNRLSDWNPVSFGAIKRLTDLYLQRQPNLIEKKK